MQVLTNIGAQFDTSTSDRVETSGNIVQSGTDGSQADTSLNVCSDGKFITLDCTGDFMANISCDNMEKGLTDTSSVMLDRTGDFTADISGDTIQDTTTSATPKSTANVTPEGASSGGPSDSVSKSDAETAGTTMMEDSPLSPEPEVDYSKPEAAQMTEASMGYSLVTECASIASSDLGAVVDGSMSQLTLGDSMLDSTAAMGLDLSVGDTNALPLPDALPPISSGDKVFVTWTGDPSNFRVAY